MLDCDCPGMRKAVVTPLAAILFAVLSAHGLAADVVWPLREWAKAAPADVGMGESPLKKARNYALTGGGSGYVIRHGKLVMSWGNPSRRYDLKSTTKSIGVTALGRAIADKSGAKLDLR